MKKELEQFSELSVSTTTVTSVINANINIVDVAKYLPLDDTIIGIKLVYAGGLSSIIRGVAKISKKKKDFYNQVTFTIRLQITHDKSYLVSCKIFHNGALHITGTHNLHEAELAANCVVDRLRKLTGMQLVQIKRELPFLNSFDNLLFSTKGSIIGWANGTDTLYIKNEFVKLDYLVLTDSHQIPVFVSSKWNDNKKVIYSLDGVKIGEKNLEFDTDISKRHFEVDLGYIYSNNSIVGTEIINYVNDFENILYTEEATRKMFLRNGSLLHPYLAFSGLTVDKIKKYPLISSEDFTTHMINTFFKAPFKICRTKLHKTFIDNELYSRFDPCSNAAVNLRFHYNSETMSIPEKRGRCSDALKKNCTCKDISVSCFNSGKMNITGLSTLEQGEHVYDFLKHFFVEHRNQIEMIDD